MLKIGITGGIGSGKSTVCKIFSALGIPVYESDSRSRWLQENNQEIIAKTKSLIGNEAYLSTGKLNREYIANMVFEDINLLIQLNQIVHPVVIADGEKWFSELKNVPYALKESALIFTANINKHLDKIIVVDAPEEIRIQRILKRDSKKSIEEIKAIIEKQKPNEARFSEANFFIHNNEIQFLVPQVIAIHKELIRQ